MNSHTIETYAKATFLAILITTILIAKLVIYILDRRSLRQTNETLRSLLNSRYSDVTLDSENRTATFIREQRRWEIKSDFFQPMGYDRYGKPVPIDSKVPKTTLSVQIYDPAPDGQGEDWLNFRLKQKFTPDVKKQPLGVLLVDTENQELKRILESDRGIKRLVCKSDADSLLRPYPEDVVELKNGRLTIVRHVHLTTMAKAEKFFALSADILRKCCELAERQMGSERFSQLESVLDVQTRDDWIYDDVDSSSRPHGGSASSEAESPEVMAPERGIGGDDYVAGYLDGAESSQSRGIPSRRRSRSSLSR